MTTPRELTHSADPLAAWPLPDLASHPYPPARPLADMPASFPVARLQVPLVYRGSCAFCREPGTGLIARWRMPESPASELNLRALRELVEDYQLCHDMAACFERAQAAKRAERARQLAAGWAAASVALGEALAAQTARPATAKRERPSQARRPPRGLVALLPQAQDRTGDAPTSTAGEPEHPVPGSPAGQDHPSGDAA